MQVSERAEDQSSFWWRYFVLGCTIEIAIVVPLIYLTSKANEESTTGLVEGTVFYAIYYSMFAVNAYVDATYIANKPQDEIKQKNSLKDKNLVGNVFWGLVAGGAFGAVVGGPTGSLASGMAMFAISSVAVALTLWQRDRYPEPANLTSENEGFMITDERYAVLSFTSKMALVSSFCPYNTF